MDDINIRLAHNQMQPDLELQGTLSSNGLNGTIPNSNPPPAVLVTGLGAAYSQVYQFQFPTYGFSMTLNLPIRNRAAEAALGTSEVNKKRDLYSQRGALQAIELEARNAEQRKYDLGVETLFVLLDTQTQLQNADLVLVNAQISYQLALTAVQHATGELLERYHVQIKDPKPSLVP